MRPRPSLGGTVPKPSFATDPCSPAHRPTSRYPDPAMPANGRSNGRLIELTPPTEKAFLVAVDTGADDGWTAQDSLVELANLATTAGADVVGAEWQNRRHVDPNWYVGKGK